MKYIAFAAKPDYIIYVEEDRYIEFSQNYVLDNSRDQQSKNLYLYDCIMAGWVKREPQE
jgi:hypothetical protein